MNRSRCDCVDIWHIDLTFADPDMASEASGTKPALTGVAYRDRE